MYERGIKYLNLSFMAGIQHGADLTTLTHTWNYLRFKTLTDDSLFVLSSTGRSILHIQYDDSHCHICVKYMLANKADFSSTT